MPKLEKTYRLFIASPGDVRAERNLIETLVHTINKEHSNVSLAPVRWEHDTPDFNIDDTQAQINTTLAQCDVMVAIFGDTLGTPTARAIGGAVEEVTEFNKQIILYLKKDNEERLKEELGQYFPKVDNRVGRTYSDISDLERQASSDIRNWFNRQIKPPVSEDLLVRKTLLIEDWLPATELGIESVRERAAASALPPIYFLHVWWARRPLVASAGAVLGSLLPAWSAKLSAEFTGTIELETQTSYHEWFLRLCGIWGDPIEARKQINAANAAGIKLKGNGYGYKQAYKNSPSARDISLLHKILEHTWGRLPSVCDPTAGGGSIPYVAVRYRLPTYANDLNPVAASVLRIGVELSARFGQDLLADLRPWGEELTSRLGARLAPFFELQGTQERVVAYVFARTVACPRTGKAVPLASDWSLRRGDNPVAVRLITERDGQELDGPEFEIIEGRSIDFDPKKEATWSRGKAVSPWDHLTIDSDYIKAEAQAGRMDEVLYAVAIRTTDGRGFRVPTDTDLATLIDAQNKLEALLPQWEADGILPVETVPEGNKTREPQNYGMSRWRDFFTPRQLLVHGCFVEELRKLIPEVRAAINDSDRADAVLALLSLMQGKALNYNARLGSWNVNRQVIRSVFDSHSFAFKNTFAEFEGTELYAWTLDQLTDAYSSIANLLDPDNASHQLSESEFPEPQITVTCENAGNLASLDDESQTLVCIDPPYYDNVMYAELSDFFYVWEKRTLGALGTFWHDLFQGNLTDKQNEAVANQALFAAEGRGAKARADGDYTNKMGAIFKECHRIIADNGILTIMFTHKRVDAWDSLGTALVEAGFTIEATWPVHTESEQSLHQARQNSATSTVFMVCRKRLMEPDIHLSRTTYLAEIAGEIQESAIEAYDRSYDQGLRGVDLLLSTYGPALSVLSQHWPVYSEEADDEGRSRPLRPEEALAVARNEVTKRIKSRIVGPQTVDFDATTDFAVLIWEVFKARKMPFDEARRLALAVGGLEMDHLVRDKVITAERGNVVVLEPRERLRREGDQHLSGVNRERRSFDSILDAVHTALYLVGEDGPGSAKRWIDERALTRDQRFLDCLQALANAVPRSKSKGEWNVTEAGLLDRLVTSYFSSSISLPQDPLEAVQGTLGGD